MTFEKDDVQDKNEIAKRTPLTATFKGRMKNLKGTHLVSQESDKGVD